MSKIYLCTEENIDEVEQISLLTPCTTKLHLDIIRLPYLFWIFLENTFPKISNTPFINPLFLPLLEYRYVLLFFVKSVQVMMLTVDLTIVNVSYNDYCVSLKNHNLISFVLYFTLSQPESDQSSYSS